MPPADVAAERSVLAGVMQHGIDAYLDAESLVTHQTMTVDSNQVIWRCLHEIYRGGEDVRVDFPLLLSTAQGLGLKEFLDRPEEVSHLRAIMNLPVRKENVLRQAAKVRKLEIARQLQLQMVDSQKDLDGITGDESSAHIFGLVENPLFDLTTKLSAPLSEGPQSVGKGLREYIEHLKANQGKSPGLSVNFPRYEAAIGGGFRPGCVDVIAARTGRGKSMLKQNMGLYVTLKHKIPVLDLDTEMTREQWWNRGLARLSGVPIARVETGAYTGDEEKEICRAAEYLERDLYHHMEIKDVPFEEAMSWARKWVKRTVGLDDNGHAKPCLILFDYLKLVDTGLLSRNLSEFQALGFMMATLHNFMVRWRCPCLALAQMNREGATVEEDTVVAGSDRIAWFCSSLTLLRDKNDEEIAEYYGKKPAYNMKLVPVKTRHGPGLSRGDYINVHFEKGIARFTEGPTNGEFFKQRLVGQADAPVVP